MMPGPELRQLDASLAKWFLVGFDFDTSFACGPREAHLERVTEVHARLVQCKSSMTAKCGQLLDSVSLATRSGGTHRACRMWSEANEIDLMVALSLC